MATWVTVVVAATVALASLGVAVLVARPRRRETVTRPAWAIPAGGQLRDARFRVRWRGYDPTQVDAVLAAAADAVAALAHEAGPEASARAEDRIRTARAAEAGHRPTGDRRRSGEELEDDGGDGVGVLDR